VPGPASYNIFSGSDKKGFTLRGRGEIDPVSGLPGPGEYDVGNASDRRGPGFGKAARDRYGGTTVPGPGSYDSPGRTDG
jgi:hypothetical protein